MEELGNLIEDQEMIREWRKEEIMLNLKNIWAILLNWGWGVKIDDGLKMGSRMSLILAESGFWRTKNIVKMINKIKMM